MRTIEENFEDKAKFSSDLCYFIGALEYPLENEDDQNATLGITVQESGVRTTTLYSRPPIPNLGLPPMVSDGTIHETAKLHLDKETRDCIVDALKGRLETLKKEIKGLI